MWSSVSHGKVGPDRLTVRTPLFQGGDRGSIPRRGVGLCEVVRRRWQCRSAYSAGKSGAVAQSVRVPVCHTGGREFESRQPRSTFFDRTGRSEARRKAGFSSPRCCVCRGRSSVGRALEWHSRGQGFDSPRLHCRPDRAIRSVEAPGSGGGIGRRAGFRILWGQPCEGSSPSPSTSKTDEPGPKHSGVSVRPTTSPRFGAHVLELVDRLV